MSDHSPDTIDQTTFSESAPLMDQPEGVKPIVAKDKAPKAEAPAPKRPIKKPLPLPIMAGGVILVVLAVVVLATLLMPRSQTGVSTGEPQASATPKTTSNLPPELQKAISSLEDDVKEADPQNNDLPFPPVSFQLHLTVPQITN